MYKMAGTPSRFDARELPIGELPARISGNDPVIRSRKPFDPDPMYKKPRSQYGRWR